MNFLKPLLKITDLFREKKSRSTRKTKSIKSSQRKKISKKKVLKRVSAKRKKTTKKKAFVKKAAPPKKPKGLLVGTITHYYPKVHAAVLNVLKPISLADRLHIKGKHTDFKFKVKSMQINLIPIDSAKKGEEIGLEVPSEVRERDQVFLIT